MHSHPRTCFTQAAKETWLAAVYTRPIHMMTVFLVKTMPTEGFTFLSERPITAFYKNKSSEILFSPYICSLNIQKQNGRLVHVLLA